MICFRISLRSGLKRLPSRCGAETGGGGGQKPAWVVGFGIAEEKAVVDGCAAAESLSGLASAKSGALLWLADGLVPLFGALRELVFEREEEGGVQRGEAVCLCFRVAFGVTLVLGEWVSGLRFLYNSYNSALVDRRGAWMSELDSACLKLDTVHFWIGGNAGLVDRDDDAGELACVLAGEGELEPGRFGGRVARRVAGRPREGAWGSIARGKIGLGAGWLRGCYRRGGFIS